MPRSNLGELISNLRAGLRLAFFLRAPQFYISRDQLVLLAGVQVLLYFLVDVVANGLPGEFDPSALPQALFFVLLLLFAGYVISRFQKDSALALAVPVMALSVAPVFAALFLALSTLGGYGLFETLGITDAWGFYLYLLYIFAVYARGLMLLAGMPRLAANAAWILALVIAPQLIFPRGELWIGEALEAEYSTLPAITDESVLHAQPALFESALQDIADERPGVADLYFIGFGGDASQDVFMKELQLVRELFDSRFDTKGRSVALINNRQSLAHTPIASATNLAAAIDQVAKKMNREEDVLLLFLTTHGSEHHELSVVLEPLTLDQIEPAFLRDALDRAQIEWRIVVISACYSGGFISALSSEKSLIVTAADANHPSFGCAPDSELTYFGRAFFAEELKQTYSLSEAFDKAVVSIAQRERKKGFDASHPQIAMGARMKEKLAELEARLKNGSQLAKTPKLAE